ncbi:hypothetical protein U9M48_008978 [Paspalum notatum var. saurae]|uniref:Uncharacterized protein n=1 Tax=Paspalum notatum var. saurae TaxID=547442 RepID=A0AAQ3WEA7_PASNO
MASLQSPQALPLPAPSTQGLDPPSGCCISLRLLRRSGLLTKLKTAFPCLQVPLFDSSLTQVILSSLLLRKNEKDKKMRTLASSLPTSKPIFFGFNAVKSHIKPGQNMWYYACKTCNKVTDAAGSR